MAPRPRVAFVVHRYHPDIAGGAERHCRDMARHMSKHWDITVLTSCAADYRTWANEYDEGASRDGPVKVHRFPVSVERDYSAFDKLSVPVLEGNAGVELEERWIEAQGPVLPGLVEHLRRRKGAYDLFVFFTYLYWSTVRGIVEVADKAWLVPTAHDEKPIRLSVYDRVFAAPRAILFNTLAEKRFCATRFAQRAPVQEIVGCGVDHVPDDGSGIDHIRPAGRPLEPGYLLYVGRVDKAKNVHALVDSYVAMVNQCDSWPDLALVGPISMELPAHPRIRPVGFVSEQDKYALVRSASVLIQPSAFESLSLVLLESWLCGTPVLVNGECKVLRDQVIAAHGGLYYQSPAELREALTWMLSRPALGRDMAAVGREFAVANYSWDAIESKYRQLYNRYEQSMGVPARPV